MTAMNIRKIFFTKIALPFMVLAAGAKCSQAQTAVADSLSFEWVVQKVIANYPSIKRAEIEIEAADARIGLARSAYYPSVDLSASYSRLAPVTSMDIPGMGTFSLNSPNNYDAKLNVSQKIYDFGKTSSSVELERRYRELSELSAEEVRRQLVSSLLSNYYSILYLQEAIAIKDEELRTLNHHLDFVQKQFETGSATEYVILSTKVRISNTQSQRTDLLASLNVLRAQLNAFMGTPQQDGFAVKEELYDEAVTESTDRLISTAMAAREEIKIAEQKGRVASARYEIAGNMENPDLSFFATGGFKNGYIPDLNKLRGNYIVGVGLRLPIFNGYKLKYDKMQAQAEIRSSQQEVDLAGRNVTGEVIAERSNVDAAAKKISQQELQLQQAVSAYNLATTSFQAGVITNLDLLDSATALSESRLALMKSRIDYTVSLLRLRIATGERLY